MNELEIAKEALEIGLNYVLTAGWTRHQEAEVKVIQDAITALEALATQNATEKQGEDIEALSKKIMIESEYWKHSSLTERDAEDEIASMIGSFAQQYHAKESAKCKGMIPVSEKLPEKEGCYLVHAPRSFPKNSRLLVAEFYNDNNTFYSESSDQPLHDVTHWAPLPNEP